MSTGTTSHRAWLGNALALAGLLVLALALGRWQSDAWWLASPRLGSWLLAALVLLAYLGLCASILARARAQAQSDCIREDDGGTDAVLLSWASQTGFAQQLAEHTADALRGAGMAVRAMPLHRIDADVLRSHRRALFIASTTGEGDPPDHVLGFTRHVLDTSIALDGLEYAVLALGDRAYEQFCGFGRRLDQWLHHHGARPLFDRIDVDAGDAGALRHWQHRLGQLSGHADFADWSAPAYQAWRLDHRRWLNEGSSGGPAYHVALLPDDRADLDWTAGDIAEIGPRHPVDVVADWLAVCGFDGDAVVKADDASEPLSALLARSRLPTSKDVLGRGPQAVADGLQPLPHREYSIASLPSDGSLQLLVRQMRHPDGRLGSGSGWLTAHAAPGARIDLRIRRNRSFHPPVDDRPMVLIGNGTGLAGLRALLKARIAAGQHRNWLLFGERHARHDFHYRDELETWLREGRLQELDLAFSRDDPSRRTYVQHLLRERIDRLREWIAQGASIYVCGSLEGMAPEVDAVLREAVGLDALETMAADGRYCRDVY
ncbi:sulfite reductase flavoprotein subunit alpha [Lysobacter sp. S4-A87]|uniref:sulfite reductase subunit alpha n=1 Tax=Lysobacter sp. S4-A87 TaxID=2925843 RepID=UPI001F53A799|nr:sulfite reductase flavoprotein subunit alpha [Lysobacter sp. S4-A87]UNK50697.1 sulfite reductase flavoprotein subunit alpha [Lysobacter sp. S4-A87]